MASLLFAADASHATEPADFAIVATGGSSVLVLDNDDDDDNGIADFAQTDHVPVEDAREIRISGRDDVTVTASEEVRMLDGERVFPSGTTIPRASLPRTLLLQGVRSSETPNDASVVARESSGTTRELHFTVVSLSVLDGHNQRIDPTTNAVGVSHEITNAPSLPRNARWQDESPRDSDNIRIEIRDASSSALHATARLERVENESGRTLGFLGDIPLERPDVGSAFRSPFLRLVGDRIDREAPGVTARVLQVALRDRVRVIYGDAASAKSDVRVGRPGSENGLLAARQGVLRVHVLRVTPGGALSMGRDVQSALAIARNQVAIANEIWLQCSTGFGAPEDAFVRVVDPPPPALLTFADGNGLPAMGGGEIRLRVGTHRIGPIATVPNALPLETARDVARAIRRAGFRADEYQNTRTDFGANASADVVVRNLHGEPVAVEQDGQAPYSTDARQRVSRGELDLRDGITEFDNMNSTGGTLEERTMIRLLADNDPTTVDIFLINRFAEGTRQGESFIEGEGASIVNTIILDRVGVFGEREAWTQSHELGHILLNHPLHPDNVGNDRPWLLMDADASLGLVTGPKRITWDECRRMTLESGVDAQPALLSRFRRRAAAR